jgi:hypothetical protein
VAGGPGGKYLVFPNEQGVPTTNPAAADAGYVGGQQLLVDPGTADPDTSQAFKLHR